MSLLHSFPLLFLFFFFNDTATTEIYTLSLHDALPIYGEARGALEAQDDRPRRASWRRQEDRKSTRLNSSHQIISYAVFCLKKKKKKPEMTNRDENDDVLSVLVIGQSRAERHSI